MPSFRSLSLRINHTSSGLISPLRASNKTESSHQSSSQTKPLEALDNLLLALSLQEVQRRAPTGNSLSSTREFQLQMAACQSSTQRLTVAIIWQKPRLEHSSGASRSTLKTTLRLGPTPSRPRSLTRQQTCSTVLERTYKHFSTNENNVYTL